MIGLLPVVYSYLNQLAGNQVTKSEQMLVNSSVINYRYLYLLLENGKW